MRQHLRGLWLHLKARLRALATHADGLVILIVAGGAGVMLWPGLTAAGDAGWRLALAPEPDAERGAFELAVMLMWMLLWPVLPVVCATGRATGASRGDAFAQRALPALPVGPRARLAAEVLIVLAIAVAARLVWWLAGPPAPEGYLLDTAMGALVALPMVVAWAAPALTVPLLWVRPTMAVVALFAASRLGLLATPAGLAAVTLAITAGLVLTVGLEIPRWRTAPRAASGTMAMSRPALPPDVQLRRDFWLEPWRRLGWVIGGLVALPVVLLVAERLVTLPPYTVYIGSLLAFSQLVALAFRPAGSALFGWALTSRNGAGTGDFGRAWAVLPVRPESVRRAAWAHGLVAVAAVWVVVVAFVAVLNWSRTGVLGLDTPGFRIASQLLLAGLAIPPMVAGLLAAGTAGDRLHMALSGGSLLAIFNLPGIILLVGSQVMGRESKVPMVATVSLLVGLALLGSLPALRLLRRGWRRPSGA
ncbi:MAG: hypothetical protein MUF10_02665 [Thermoanaerobaculaceae bacterium]|jgi:hypothetical protein|nr:hypothetical protein [Thermoanaerobaculaceae bacterium]